MLTSVHWQVVPRPMDLTTVKNRLLDDMYNSREECIQDIRLIWKNAKMYNKVTALDQYVSDDVLSLSLAIALPSA